MDKGGHTIIGFLSLLQSGDEPFIDFLKWKLVFAGALAIPKRQLGFYASGYTYAQTSSLFTLGVSVVKATTCNMRDSCTLRLSLLTRNSSCQL